ncbi:hypothetical protein R5R35_000075 [Gryllus longicercus]|uniref:NACHT domain-containing protein n=1 Tax=Gryllus longicercus TaxID=2509291 RepID=A0AAN9VV85_9ORTH
MRSARDRFLLSGFPDDLLDQLRSPDGPWQECLPSGALVSTCELPRTGWGATGAQCTTLQRLAAIGKRTSRTKWREWDPLKNSDKKDVKSKIMNVHWLTYERGEIIWNSTDGDSRALHKYIHKMTSKCRDSPVCGHSDIRDFLEWRDSTILLTDIAGMGKSMFITRVAHAIKEARKTNWVLVVRMSEGRIMNELPASIGLHHVFELLRRSNVSKQSSFVETSTKFLEECFNSTGSMDVLIDGVDEVCPVHKEKALNILKLLQSTLHTRGGRLWVAARTMLEEDLAQTLKCAAPLTLRPFTPRDQQRYLMLHWKNSFKDVDQKELESRIGVLVNVVRQVTSSGDHSLCDVPLYTCMLAKAYEGDELLPLIGDHRVDLPSCINRLALYKKFVLKTLCVVWDKVGIAEEDRVNLGISSEDEVLEKHMLYAVLDCFNDKKLLGENYEKAKKAVNELESEFEKEKMLKKGIISDFIDGKPTFVHRSITEYLAAQWLLGKYKSLPDLTQALYDGDFGEVRYFFDALMAEGRTLHEAALAGRLTAVRAVLIHPENVNEEDRGGRRALHLAAICGHQQIVRVILEAGGDANLRDSVLGWTPLRYADAILRFPSGKWDWLSLKKDALPQLTVAEQLLSFRAKTRDAVNIIKQENLLDYAFRKDYAEIAKIFVKKGGPIFVQKLRGENFMHRAAFQGSRQVMAMLIRSGFCVNASEKNRGDTPLHVAAQEGLKDVCELLLQNGASVNKADKNGDTPLHRTAQEGHDAVCCLFLARGADKDAKDSVGRTPLHDAAVRGHDAVCRALLESGATVNVRDSRHVTALHEAARWGHAAICRMLLEHGADATVFNLRGESAFDLARKHEHEDVCEVVRDNTSK